VRRQVPACHAALESTGNTTSPLNSRRAYFVSLGRSPRTISSTLIAVVAGMSPAWRSARTRPTAGRPRRKSIKTVESRTQSTINQHDARQHDAAGAPTQRGRRPIRGARSRAHPPWFRCRTSEAPDEQRARSPSARKRSAPGVHSTCRPEPPKRRPTLCAFACAEVSTLPVRRPSDGSGPARPISCGRSSLSAGSDTQRVERQDNSARDQQARNNKPWSHSATGSRAHRPRGPPVKKDSG
jgi:hypothetical protein